MRVLDAGCGAGRNIAFLLREGYDCPTSALASLDSAVSRLTQERPDLVVVVLSPDTELAQHGQHGGVGHGRTLAARENGPPALAPTLHHLGP